MYIPTNPPPPPPPPTTKTLSFLGGGGGGGGGGGVSRCMEFGNFYQDRKGLLFTLSGEIEGRVWENQLCTVSH